jgi:glutamate-ammonia-ligase adenylyltransferase
MLENYFLTQGREWERYAWIKARVVCGDRAQELIELVRPFVFRRHLDYSAFESLRDLHQQVRREVERRDILDNIKLGPGGIREIEFIVQLFQLIRGGRDSALREPPTLTVLPLLAERNLLPASAVETLTAAYVFLRNLEHRLQYLDDKQTHALPDNDEDRELIADAMGCADVSTLLAQAEQHRSAVTQQFDSIFPPSSEEAHPLADLWQTDDAGEPAEHALRSLGYRAPREMLARIAALRASSRVRQMPEASHARMRKLVPLVIETSARMPDPDVTLERMLLLLESISRREVYLALLLQYPQTLERGARLAHASPWAADYLTRHPILLDELLDARTLYEAPDRDRLRSILRRQLDDSAHDIERQMDVLRHFKHSQTMHLLAQDLSGELPLEKLSDYLSDLADLILCEVLRLTWEGLRTRHRAEPRFAIVAYGKLGGKELGYASDLDLIFLHQDDAPEAPENYARLAQRLNNWLTSLTPAGVLYETDLRLRPDGVSGLLVSSLEGFDAYQHKQAWVWEHQALTRARFVAGAADIGQHFEAIRIDVLRQPRDLAKLRAEVVAMRKKMLKGHPNTSGKFDIKHDRGGLIDVEFIVQYLVLGYSHRHAELTGNIGNLALLLLASDLGLIAADEASAARDAYRRFRQLQHSLRLQGDKYARVEAATLSTEIAAVKKLWDSVLRAHAAIGEP